MNAHAVGAEEHAADTPLGAPDGADTAGAAPLQAVPVAEAYEPAELALSDVVPAAAPAIKFTYAGGARPLAGYTIKRGVGRGGFGEVYYALSDGGKEVALKLLRRNFDVELRGVVQCLNLKHPNLLGLYDIRTDEHGDSWVVMEFASGPSLEDEIIKHPDGMPPSEAVAWLRGIAGGVSYLHDCGIVHRDLKPANIFCDGGLVKIGDYGLSKIISCSRRSGQTESVGTVHYMAPEIANGRYGRSIDIYALGIMLHEMLTGRVPFEGESVAEVLMKHLTAEPNLSGVAEPYRSIIGRALAKDPQQRYATVADLVAALPNLPAGSVGAFDFARVSPSLERPAPAAPRAAVAGPPPVIEPVILQPDYSSPGGPFPRSGVNPNQNFSAEEGEPIQRWVRQSLAGLTTPVKVVLIIAALILLPHVVLPLAVMLGIAYCVYYCFWSITRGSPVRQGAVPIAQQSTTTAATGSRPASPPMGHVGRRRWRGRPVSALVLRPTRERMAELCGSLVLSAIVALVTTLIMIMLRGDNTSPEQFAWLALVSIVGAWGVLIPSKLWEGTLGEPVLRRFCMLVIGLGVGLFAFGLQRALWVPLPHEFTVKPAFYVGQWPPAQDVGAVEGSPQTLLTFMGYFGFLYLLIRWWRLANPVRRSRLSLWATAVCVTCSIALYLFWPMPQPWGFFPQKWGFLFTAIVAIAVQLASPWQSEHARYASD